MGALMDHRWVPDSLGEMGLPPPHAFANQQGALRHHDFVTGEISDLLARGSIIQTDRPPLVVNPLNVVEHNSKLRLILDLVYVNHFIKKEGLKFKYEGIKLTSLYFCAQLCAAPIPMIIESVRLSAVA